MEWANGLMLLHFMDNLVAILQQDATNAIKKAFKGVEGIESHLPAEIMQSEHADYQCNTALRLAKDLKRSPREVATEIISHFTSPLIKSLQIAGPGFINITLDPAKLSSQLTEIYKDPLLGVPKPKKLLGRDLRPRRIF